MNLFKPLFFFLLRNISFYITHSESVKESELRIPKNGHLFEMSPVRTVSFCEIITSSFAFSTSLMTTFSTLWRLTKFVRKLDASQTKKKGVQIYIYITSTTKTSSFQQIRACIQNLWVPIIFKIYKRIV